MSSAVVGATGAVGSALARRLFARGTTPWLIGRNVQSLEALSSELGNAPFTVADMLALDDIGGALAGQVPHDLTGLSYCVGDIALKPAKRVSHA